LPRKIQAQYLKGIYLAENKQEALRKFKNRKRNGRERVPNALVCLEKDSEGLLSFVNCPKMLTNQKFIACLSLLGGRGWQIGVQ